MKTRTKIILVVTAAAVLIAGVMGGAYAFNTSQVNKDYQHKLELGNRYLTDCDYEEAVLYFKMALELKPKSEEAALGMAEAYIGLGEYDEADDILGEIETDDASLTERFELLSEAADLEMKITSVDTTNFPQVTLVIGYKGGERAFLKEDFGIFENGEAREITNLDVQKNSLTLTYNTTLAQNDPEERTVAVEYDFKGLILEAFVDYITPILSTANMSLVSVDTSDYPTIRAYYRIEDLGSGDSVYNLTTGSFALYEKVAGGEFLAREIRSVEQLEGHAGLTIALVADKSDSISDSDMMKIKNIMTDFVSHLEYNVGDQAELLAFDTDVTQMCIFTDDMNLLKNGISNMYTSGRTALYDALKTAVNHIQYKDGARCVIAFTDGLDNESYSSSYDVIEYARQCGIPIYIIGVSYDVDEYTLQDIAEQTGGQYWFIDDLSELTDVYSLIYKEQKEMYVIEYETDMALDEYAGRELELSFAGAGYIGECQSEFTPKQTQTYGHTMHADAVSTSRYELYVSNMSWEEASEYCTAMGGHLVTINSQQEEDLVESMADRAGVSFVWLGGYTSYDNYGNMFGHWVTGEPFDYTHWCAGEPSKDDLDGVPERYIVLWNVAYYGYWSWNDTRNDPVYSGFYEDDLAFICEYEN